MKIKLKSKAVREYEQRIWKRCFVLIPKRVDGHTLVWGRCVRRRLQGDSSFEYRDYAEHVAAMLTNTTP